MKKHIVFTLFVFFLTVAPARAAIVEGLAVGSYISFGGKLWQKLDYYGETNGLTKCNSTTTETTSTCDARTYLMLANPDTNHEFDTRYNVCVGGGNYGWNDFVSSELNAWLNDANTGFISALTNSDWIINRTDWSNVDQAEGFVGNPAKQLGDECSLVNTGTAPTWQSSYWRVGGGGCRGRWVWHLSCRAV